MTAKIYVLSIEEIETLCNKAALKAIEKYSMPDKLKDLPERLSMAQVQKILGKGRMKVLNMVKRGDLELASRQGEKYKFYKNQVMSWI